VFGAPPLTVEQLTDDVCSCAVSLVESNLEAFGKEVVAPPATGVGKRTRTHQTEASAEEQAKVADKARSANAEVVEKVRELVSFALSGATTRQSVNPACHNADSAIDPSEPVYCVCRQVAFGDMIACDNSDCPVEWFHCQCVGVGRGNQPTSWFCKDCLATQRDMGGK
jgi:hypothetical protein